METRAEESGFPVHGPSTRNATGARKHDGALSEYEDEYPLFKELVKDLPSLTSYHLPEDELRHLPNGSKDTGWQNCLNSVEKYDRELCQAYREQIDTLLVFAGLFSAVVTAFAVESYQWLQEDPMDTSVELLRDMVGLLSQNLNLTAPPTFAASSRLSGAAIVRINTVWFLSLSLSLSAALVGILCKQWLREFERNVGQSPEMALAVRYIRYHGFEFWKVGTIVSSVPIIMQMALALFIVGVVELLWKLHIVVACFVTTVAGLTLAFYLVTTCLPAIQYASICIRCCLDPLPARDYSRLRAFLEPQCAFKSAQAWLILWAIQPAITRLLKAYGTQFTFHFPPHHFALAVRPADSWVTFDVNWVKRREHIHVGPRCAFETLAWIAESIDEMHLSSSIWHCVWARWLKNSDDPRALVIASMEISTVARCTYPGITPLSRDYTSSIRAQALVFQCSLRTDIPIQTALELFIRLAPRLGVTSRWTREAVHAILVVYRDRTIHFNDELATGLFRLAELQTHTLLLGRCHTPASQLNGALTFKEILVIIHKGSRLRHTLMPAMSGLALQWLRAHPPEQIGLVARSIFEDMVTHLTTQVYYGQDLRQVPGIVMVTHLGGAVAELWPEFVRTRYTDNQPQHQSVLRELLAMHATDFSCQDPGGVTQPHSSSDHDAGGALSNPPVPAAHGNVHHQASAHAAAHDPPAESSQHVCIDVHSDVDIPAKMDEVDLNYRASSEDSPAAPDTHLYS